MRNNNKYKKMKKSVDMPIRNVVLYSGCSESGAISQNFFKKTFKKVLTKKSGCDIILKLLQEAVRNTNKRVSVKSSLKTKQKRKNE